MTAVKAPKLAIYYLNYHKCLRSWSRVLPEKLTVAKLVNKISAYYGTQIHH